jgi:hypothetical protein
MPFEFWSSYLTVLLVFKRGALGMGAKCQRNSTKR